MQKAHEFIQKRQDSEKLRKFSENPLSGSQVSSVVSQL